MVRGHIITRVSDGNILRERVWHQCEKCGHKFEYYTSLFTEDTVNCPKCLCKITKDNTDFLD
ncbi:hypothetical protein [Sporomusa acidovorans]|uniref:Uncharacterized protein n=1 Tax=Sporomusa acidovorans (strain ATCC 49682 / DSM 3132 / Mol) TaxID=1123286 RepID=A0ABZ3JA87_SPOA4|nr:hypothetical protein [Sporomusa acidovorans]OZC21725.1 hypothetical protein SPACI_18000 [Sporomusa acidovorans DSM 3132]SDD59045.1 hypothetical protein SAMN04488499_1002133 [Sporomusa acidovorans]